MKSVQAYVKTHKLADVSAALHHVPGVSGVTTYEARGWGRGKQAREERDHGDQVRDFEKHAKIEVLCEEELVSEVVQAIGNAARTGLVGDGLIFVCPVEDVAPIGAG